MQAVAVAVAVVAVSVVACISFDIVVARFPSGSRHTASMNNEMFLESEEDASCSGAAPECSRTVRMLSHKKSKEISGLGLYSISQIIIFSQCVLKYMRYS